MPSPPQPLSHPLWDQLHPSSSPTDSQNRLAKVLPLRRLEAINPSSNWWHRDGGLPMVSVRLIAMVGSPFLLESLQQSHQWLLIVHDGCLRVQHPQGSVELGVNRSGILPNQPWTLIAQQSSSFTALGFDPLQLLSTARGMAPVGWTPPPAIASHLNSFLSLPTEEEATCSSLVNAISLLLPAIHHVAELGEDFLDIFLLQQQLYRLIAALIFADLRDGHPTTESVSHQPDRRLDPVLDYISLNIDQPLSLNVLESQSNYCRRTLHYAFQQRFGCSPKQWIRQQRMALALERLKDPQLGDSVAAVAKACGYRSLGRFSIDFQRFYGCKPSAVLRHKEEPSFSNSTTSLEP